MRPGSALARAGYRRRGAAGFRVGVGALADHRRGQELLGLVGLDPPTAPSIRTSLRRPAPAIAIARALACRPDFIVCDEPTSALDVSVQAQIFNLMRDLQDLFGLTYLFISHNLAVVRHMANHIGVMYLGRLVEVAPARELFRAPGHHYSRMLLDAVPDLDGTGRQRKPVAAEPANRWIRRRAAPSIRAVAAPMRAAAPKRAADRDQHRNGRVSRRCGRPPLALLCRG